MTFFASFSLRQWLTVPFTVLMFGVAALTGGLSYLAGSEAVNEASRRLLLEMVARIGEAVDSHVHGAAAVLEAAFPAGKAVPEAIDAELDTLRTRLWIATSLHPELNNHVYYGNRLGQSIGVLRLGAEDAKFSYRSRAGVPRSMQLFTGIDGQLEDAILEDKVFDTRPWYQAAQASVSPVWTSVYLSLTTDEFVVTRSRRVLDANGAVQGVVATDLPLWRLNKFVRSLSISPHGVAFIIEPDGKLIATSSGANIGHLSDTSSVRVNALDADSPLLRSAYLQLRGKLGSLQLGSEPRVLVFDGPNGEAVQLAFNRLKEADGLNWIVVVAVPRSDFMQGMTANIMRTLGIGLLGAVLAVVLGLRIVGWVDRDIQRLTQALQEVGEGHLEAPLDVYRSDEIGVLANAFRKMQQRLRTDVLTGLSNREMLLHSINQRIAQRRRQGDGLSFAVVFVDLNNFKLINDHLGHDAGDQVLTQIAARLRKTIRPGDVVARYAGDEFVLLINDVPSHAVAEQVRTHLEAALLEPLEHMDLTALPDGAKFGGAVGVAMYPSDGSSAESLIESADQDMYERKRASRSAA